MSYEVVRENNNIIIKGKVRPVSNSLEFIMGERRTNLFCKLEGRKLIFSEFFLLIIIKVLDSYLEKSDKQINSNFFKEWFSFGNASKDTIREILILLRNSSHFFSSKIEDIEDKELNLGAMEKTLNWAPLERQKPIFKVHRFMKKFYGLRGIYLDASVGSGKTAMSLMLAETQEVDNVIVVGLNSTMDDVWVKTITTAGMYKEEQTYWSVKSKEPYNGERFLIANFESASKLEKALSTLTGKTMMIVDEAQSINEDNSNISQLIQRYATTYKFEDIVLMSGTPLKMHHKELLPMMTILDPLFTSKIRSIYKDLMYGNPKSIIGVMPNIYTKYRIKLEFKNSNKKDMGVTEIVIPIKPKYPEIHLISTIRKEMKEFIIFRKKQDEPNMDTYIAQYLTMREDAFKDSNTSLMDFEEYKEFVEDVKLAHKRGSLSSEGDKLRDIKKYEKEVLEPYITDVKTFRIVKTYYKYPMLKYLGEALGKILTRARINASRDLVSQLNLDNIIDSSRKKVLVLSNYIEVADDVMKASKNYKGMPVYGKQIGDIRNKLENLDNEGDEREFISATYSSLGTGVPVIQCSTLLAMEKPFRDYKWIQAKGRVDREGQDGTVRIVTLEMETDEPNIYNRTDELLTQSLINVTFLTSGENESIDSYELPSNMSVINSLSSSIKELSLLDNIKDFITFQEFKQDTLVEIMGWLINNSLLTKRKTFISLFSIPMESNELVIKGTTNWSIKMDDRIVELDSLITNPPLSFQSKLNIPKGFMSIVDQDYETTIGRVITNYLLFEYGLNGKMNYINEQFSYNKKESDIISSLITNVDKKTDKDITIEDFRKVARVCSYLRSLSGLLTVATTEEITYPEPEFFKHRDKVRNNYKVKYGEDWTRDKYNLLEYEEEMMNYMLDKFKDNPTLHITMNKKTLKSFKMLYISIGIMQKMDETSDDINVVSSLEEGHSLDKEVFTAMNNSTRFGSVSKANATVVAGVVTKHITTALQSFMITIDDCGSKDRSTMRLHKEFLQALLFLDIYHKGKLVDKNKSDYEKLIGEIIDVRLPTNCKVTGDNFCKKCCGVMTSLFPKSLPHLFIKLSGDGLQYQLSRFHGSEYIVREIDYNDLF